ncbi:hypothetical protein Aca07nite_84600 [Actinoplanes capillaceus]|uniref:Barstar (barnase inhibitor) domain-containing protein n=1 Tax=Actinoplanes campanulatus TaxID=113559 RepID=A0ABQ3WY51_9ACTN|nr:hypothetical protein [Actinoplanes capillaceus]GID51185.1 hypothetical protein Aca07nite_84600 [Actinoplanes capillaceus]
MSVLDTLYHGTLAERARQRRWDQPCRTKILACLPARAARTSTEALDEVRARLSGHADTDAAALDTAHFPLWRHPDHHTQHLLVSPRINAGRDAVSTCAGAPIGLLDLNTTAARLLPVAATSHTAWAQIVQGATTAAPWWPFLDRHHSEPDQYPLDAALSDFAAQPQIAAMLRHDADTVPAHRFDGDCYGPGLSALHTGAAAYADYLTGVLTYAGGLLSLDGDLLVPSWTDLLVEQSLMERTSYHQQARHYLTALNPTTVIVAVTCHR